MFMETRFGHDFSRIRIHADSPAAQTAKDLGARAYAVGSDIVFAAGEYVPGTAQGRRLLAHELAHTIQQRSSAAPAPQAKLRLSEEGDSAEVAADRAADAVMRGDQPPTLAPAPDGVVQRQPARQCTRGAPTGDVTPVTCPGGAEYDVRTNIVQGMVPSTQAGVTGGLEDNSTLYLQLRVCRGGNEVRVTPSMNVATPLQQLIQNLLSGSPALSGQQIQPRAEFSWTLSRDFEISVSGGPVVVTGAPRTGWEGRIRGQSGRVTGEISAGSDPTLTGPGGQPELHGGGSVGVATDPVRSVSCYEPTVTVTYSCTPITHTPARERTPADDVQAYVFFDYATADVIPPTPTVMRGSEIVSSGLSALAADGYRVQSIDAHTSPEGRRGAPRRGGGFVGNDALSEQRRDAALTWLRGACPECIATEPASTAESELYSGESRPGVELEGDPLTRHAREGFLGRRDDLPRDPLARPRDDRLAALPLARQRAEIYPRLRRAVIHLHRAEIPAVSSRREPGAAAACPQNVVDVMRR
jgi:hypothetical protein